MNLPYFKDILKMTELELIDWIPQVLQKRDYKRIYVCEDYIYAEGNLPILLCAHVDTIHRLPPEDIFYDQEQNVLWSPDGIGGDDRCGVYSILKLTENYHPYILLSNWEEEGGIGTEYFLNDYLDVPPVYFLIGLDRRNKNDAVFYDCGNKLFQEYILEFGFKFAYGSFSDISLLSPAWNIASVNLSMGYYNEHTLAEFIRTDELDATIDKVKKILNDKRIKYYDYQEEIFKGYQWPPAKRDKKIKM